MIITVELSLYPLDNEYKSLVENFIVDFKGKYTFNTSTNGMSTTVTGPISDLFPALQERFQSFLEHNEGIFVMKVGKGELTTKNLPASLK